MKRQKAKIFKRFNFLVSVFIKIVSKHFLTVEISFWNRWARWLWIICRFQLFFVSSAVLYTDYNCVVKWLNVTRTSRAYPHVDLIYCLKSSWISSLHWKEETITHLIVKWSTAVRKILIKRNYQWNIDPEKCSFFLSNKTWMWFLSIKHLFRRDNWNIPSNRRRKCHWNKLHFEHNSTIDGCPGRAKPNHNLYSQSDLILKKKIGFNTKNINIFNSK